MAPLPPMSLEDLLEHASLDALALLDEQDAALFERTFYAATPEVQRQVRELQARIATDPLLLSAEEADEALRASVLNHLATRIRQSREELEPVAFVSGGTAVPSRHRIGTILKSSLIWQAASFALLAALVTSIIFFGRAVTEAERMARNVYREEISDRLRAPLADVWTVIQRAETRIPLSNDEQSLAGVIFIKEGIGSTGGDEACMVAVVVYGLPDTEESPVLYGKDSSGTEVVQIALSRSTDGHGVGFARVATLNRAALAACTFTVVGASGEVLRS